MRHDMVSVSSGKDSTATLLLAKEREVSNLSAIFADTGHESPIAYDYLDTLEKAVGIKIKRIKADFSKQIERKRQTVAEKWPETLPPILMADKPGYWRPTKNLRYKEAVFNNDEDKTAEGIMVSPPMLIRKDGFVVDACAQEPSKTPKDPYTPHKEGHWVWEPSIRGLSASEAQELTEQRIETALEMLVPTGNPFLDMCLWKGRFPSTKARFCTEELKVLPIQQQVVIPILKESPDNTIESWQGIRWDESLARANAVEREGIEPDAERVFAYRPILSWTAQDVFDLHRKHNVPWNPLYEQGMGRVGCMPCINCRKDELREIATRFPEEIERLAHWEKLVSQVARRGSSTFFSGYADPTASKDDVITHETHGVHRLVEWSKTARGGRQYDIFFSQSNAAATENETPQCTSIYGLCES